MKIVIHASPHIEWQGRYAKHAQEGLSRHGIQATITSSSTRQPCDLAIIMGPNAWRQIERSSRPYIMFNRKFLGNDPKIVHQNCAISWNGFNGDGTFCVDAVDPKRIEKYINPEKDIRSWNKDGKYLLLCEQSNTGRSRTYRTINQYYDYVKKHATLPIKFRKKPVGEEAIDANRVQQELIGAKAIVHLNSTISIDAMMAGIPVISLDVGDPLYAITGHTLDDIRYPDRLPLFQYLAHCQWDETEIATGKFWEHIYPMRGPKLCELKGYS